MWFLSRQMARNERFPSSFQLHIQNMIQILVSHVRQKSRDRDAQDESKNANISIAAFIKVRPGSGVKVT